MGRGQSDELQMIETLTLDSATVAHSWH